MKNMFCSNFHFKLKRNLDDESDEEIDDMMIFFAYLTKNENQM